MLRLRLERNDLLKIEDRKLQAEEFYDNGTTTNFRLREMSFILDSTDAKNKKKHREMIVTA